VNEKSRLRTFRLLALAGSVVFALVITEIFLRMLNFRPGTMDPAMYIRNDNELLPFKLQPGYQGYCAGRAVTIDADGNRVVRPSYNDLHREGKAKPDRTVLLLGDSGVFGFGVSDRETIASQLQDACFNKKLNYEIKNIGVCGYTSWNEYAALAEYLKSSSVTDVILLYVPNDLTFDNDYFGIGKGKNASFSQDEDRLHRFTRFFYSNVYVSYLISDSAKRIVSMWNHEKSVMAFDESAKQPEIDYSMQALRKIQDLGTPRNIRFSVAIYRDVAYFDDASGCLKYEGVIENNLDRNGIKWFVAKSHTDNLKAVEIRASWSDPHPGAKAIGFIVTDIMKQL
jgi:hypothetical protein